MSRGGALSLYAPVFCILICLTGHEVNAQLSVTSLPDILFNGSNTRNIVEGSVIWLFCEVNSTSSTLSLMWNKDGKSLVQDVPHVILIRTFTSDSTTLLLVLDNVVYSDAGLYQCSDGENTVTGNPLDIAVLMSNMAGVLRIVSGTTFFANRTAQSNGDSVTLTYTAGHVGDDDTNNYDAPSGVWLKDGTPFRTTPTNMVVGSNGKLSSTLSFTFLESDAGVYHCIFTGTSSDIYGTIPLRLDTGSFTKPVRISPPAIFLSPPEKLVLEVSASGGYDSIVWTRDGSTLGTTAAPAPLSEFTNFFEIFVREPTTTSDYGQYDVFYTGQGGVGTEILVVPPENPNTTYSEGQSESVTVSEGNSVDISCKSTGGPVPTITWTFNNQLTNFSQTDVITQATTTEPVRQPDGTFLSTVTPGNVISTLYIVDAQYPTHDGVYTCTGNNSMDVSTTTSSVDITIEVQVVPVIQLTAAPRSTVNIGENVTLTCTVNRGHPMDYSFEWYHNGTLINSTSVMLNSTTLNLQSIMMTDLGTYMCYVTNDAGSGIANISISLGVHPRLSVSLNETVALPNSEIEQVCFATEGDLPISLSWSGPNDIEIMPSSESNTSVTIIIKTESTSGYGIYTCMATNIFGSSSITLRVIQAVAPLVELYQDVNESIEIEAGKNLSLAVRITTFNYPLTNITWTFNDANIIDGQDRNILTIPSLTEPAPVISTIQRSFVVPIDSGMYSISATNPVGNSVISFNVTVRAPAFITEPNDHVTRGSDAGLTLILNCTARGVPAPTFTWSPNTTNLITSTSSTDGEGYTFITSILTITNIQRTDFIYSCMASNLGGLDSRNFSLTINFPPTNVSTRNAEVQALSPDSVTLSCSAEGLPLSSFIWIRTLNDGTETMFNSSNIIIQGQMFSISSLPEGTTVTSKFTISRTFAIDSGTYVCMAINRLGNSTANSTVVVYERPMIISPMESEQFMANEQTDITFTCIASGFPAPSISFIYDGQTLDHTDNRLTLVGVALQDRVMVGNEEVSLNVSTGLYEVKRTLTLFNAADDDSGSFLCSASANISGSGEISTNVSFSLLVYVAANITESPLSVAVTSPGTAMFICTASGLPRPNITWTGPDGTILISGQNNTDIMINYVNEREIKTILQVTMTLPATSGIYVCNTTNGVRIPQAITSIMVSLIVYVVPVITSYLPMNATRYIANVSSMVTFRCMTVGVPPPDIQWYKGETLINSSTDMRVMIDDADVTEPERELATVTRVLSLSNTNTNDSRRDYTCRASNIAMNGIRSRSFELFVQVPPTVMPLAPGQTIPANQGEVTTLSFSIVGAIPMVKTDDVRWYYTTSAPSGIPNFNSPDFQEITALTNRTSVSTLSFSSDRLSLNVSNIVQSLGNVTETDQGRYFLRASNPAGDVSNHIDLVVNGPPQIVGGPQNREVLGSKGNNVTFSCEAIANPQHEVSWSYTDSSDVTIANIANTTNESEDRYCIFMDGNETRFGELTVLNVTYEDRGTYTCTASNSVGYVSASGILTVQVAPALVDGGITTPKETLLNESVAIFCLATGFPTPNITWQKNGEELIRTNISVFINFSFIPRITFIDNDTMDFKSRDFMGSILDLIMNNNMAINTFDTTDNHSIVGVLLFNNVVRESTGNYICTASNKLPTTDTVNITSSPVRLLVLERPDPPVNASILDVGPQSILLSWIPTFDGYRPVLNFLIYIRNVDASSTFVKVANLSSNNVAMNLGIYRANITNAILILPFTQYSVLVVSCNIIGCSDQSEASLPVRTDQYASSPPYNVIMVAGSASSITLTWNIPMSSNGIITHYNVSYDGFKTYNASFFQQGTMLFNSSTAEVTSNTWRSILVGLIPGTTYRIRVAAVNGAAANNGLGELSSVIMGDTISVPPPAPPQPPVAAPSPLSSNVRTHTLEIIKFSEMNGRISHYQIVVLLLPEDQTANNLQPPDVLYKSIDDLGKYNTRLCNEKPSTPVAYITAEFGQDLLPADRRFIVGAEEDDGKNSPNDQPETYENGPLCHSATYTFFIRAYPVDNSVSNNKRSVRQVNQRQYTSFTSSNYYSATTIPAASSNSAGVAIGIVIVLLLLAAVAVSLVIIFVFMKQKRVGLFRHKEIVDYKMEKLNGDPSLDYIPPAAGSSMRNKVPLGSLADHVENMHLNENCGFFEEYRMIQEKSPSKPCDTCALPEHKPRNRYANIQCFEETRVIVKPIDDAKYDYVNANHIDGYNRPREYIASQGPLPGTVADMWRVIWEYDIPTVVMLTNLVEKMKIKCSQYWPDSGSAAYSNYTVTLVNTISLSDFVIRYFRVKNTLTGETKEVHQFHYISWPDFGVPRHATPLLYFLRKIHSMHKYSDERPILVHCSAGVGRTGTLITIDNELQRAAKENCIDAYNFVVQLRQQRNYMVQTDAQYVFLHDAILEGALSGDTEVTTEQLSKHMKTLQEVDEEEESGYKKEFQQLRQFKVKVSEFSDANEDTNKFKNRVANALPYNYNRVIIKMKPGIGGSDYINASFIDGYTKKRTYIATQGPLENTKEDFWRMVWEKSVSVIVMLAQLQEKEKEQCAQYWPSSKEDAEKMGDFTIELMEEGSFEDYITRDLKIVEISTANSRTVRQFHFIAWPENGAPESGAGMVDLIDQVTRKQQQTGDKPILVHCSAGIGRTGAFCCLSTAIERVKAEGMVDVFYNIKHLRTQRAHMVQSVEQYAFCYNALLEYVQSFSNYSNFQ